MLIANNRSKNPSKTSVAPWCISVWMGLDWDGWICLWCWKDFQWNTISHLRYETLSEGEASQGEQIKEQFPAPTKCTSTSPSTLCKLTPTLLSASTAWEEVSTKSSLLTLPALLSVARTARASIPRFCISLAWAAGQLSGASLSNHGAPQTEPSPPCCCCCSRWWGDFFSFLRIFKLMLMSTKFVGERHAKN